MICRIDLRLGFVVVVDLSVGKPRNGRKNNPAVGGFRTNHEKDNLVVVHNNRPKIIVVVQCLFNRIARRAFWSDAIAKCNIVVIE